MIGGSTYKAGTFYVYAVLLLVAGVAWLMLSATPAISGHILCPFRKITSLPCPSCGSTTSVSLMMSGQWQSAFYANPLGYVIAIVMIGATFWLTVDIATGRRGLYNTYYTIEDRLRRRPLLLFIILSPVIAIWIWKLMST